jgi:hypothetical protein
VVYDTSTKLTWQRSPDSATGHSWEEARAHCAGLDLDGGGFRLPEIAELQTLAYSEIYNELPEGSPVYIDPVAFPSVVEVFASCLACGTASVWSATPYAEPPGVWTIQMRTRATIYEDPSGGNIAWCVR